MSLKEMYYYWFYQYYTVLSKPVFTKWGNAMWKASILMLGLEIWALFSVKNYYEILSGKRDNSLTLFPLKVMLPVSVLILINLAAFYFSDKWKGYVKEFDKWPKEKNKKGRWIVLNR
jgi:hypothetical protein